MKKTIKKSLIYLLFTMLLVPTWLITEMSNATHAKAAGQPADIVINEIAWAGSNLSSSDEWIELRNMTGVEKDIAGWKIENAATSSGTLTIPANSKISANSYYLISNYNIGSPDTILNITPDWFTASVSLSNSAVQYVLKDEADNIIDIAGDGISDPFAGSNSPKKSMERNIIPGDGRFGSSWHDSTGRTNLLPGSELATPGAANLNAAPVISGVLDGGYYKDDVTISATDYDLVSFEIDGVAPSNPVTFGIEGFHIAVAKDSAGNETIINFTIDKTVPTITLNGDSIVTIEKDSVYSDLGATALDNIDGDISAEVIDTANLVDTSVIQDYIVTYNVTDRAGNSAEQVMRTVHVVETVIDSPQVYVSVSGKKITVSWDEVGGATDYLVYVGTSTSNWIISGASTSGATNYSITFASYGDYIVRVVAVNNSTQSSVTDGVNQKTVSVQYVAPAVEETVEAVTVAPEVAVASEPAPLTPTITTPSSGDTDSDDGVIKGEEESATDETDINWTPWIILFILIILAGAATGGYFYWFGGEDEVEKVVKSEKPRETKKDATVKKNNNKKIKRW